VPAERSGRFDTDDVTSALLSTTVTGLVVGASGSPNSAPAPLFLAVVARFAAGIVEGLCGGWLCNSSNPARCSIGNRAASGVARPSTLDLDAFRRETVFSLSPAAGGAKARAGTAYIVPTMRGASSGNRRT
jgi:hypothetical protein